MTAVQGTVSRFSSLADGTLRIQLDIHQKDSRQALELLCEVGRQVAVAALAGSDAELETARADLSEQASMAADVVAGLPVPTEDECDNNAGKLMQKFYRNGFFHATPVLEALGPDANFLQWCRSRPTCWACDATGVTENPIQAAHYRKVAAGAGTSIKPPYSALPLCRKCHLKQHNEGYSAIANVPAWEGWVAKSRQEWGHQRLREVFGTTSMRAVPQGYLTDWMKERELEHLIPKDFR